tara:strand:+ start:183 stop:1553 length:1371 start_codon:yes stop_codon:yes gene_type:complete
MATSSLAKTFGSSGNRRTFTISIWAKRTVVSTAHSSVFSSGVYPSDHMSQVFFEDTDILNVSDYNGASLQWKFETNRVFRDTSGWYHICIAVDTTQVVESDRFKLYINGVQETSFSTEDYPSLNADCGFNLDQVHSIGVRSTAALYFSGSMSNIAFVDGTALSPTSFGEVDSTSGIWKFKAPSGITWGSNGFWLKGENSGALGTDSSGNANTFTVATGTPTQSIDTPSIVYNNITNLSTYIGSSTAGNGGNSYNDVTGSGQYTYPHSNIGLQAGKWYAEVKLTSNNTGENYIMLGIAGRMPSGSNNYLGQYADNYVYYANTGNKYNSGSGTSYGDSFTTGDIIGIAVDCTNNKIYYSKNGTWQNGGDPTSGASGTGAAYTITAATSTMAQCYHFSGHNWSSTSGTTVLDWNFGIGYFGTTAVASAGTSSSGDDSVWEYNCPTGYYGLNTENINTYG